MAETRIELTGWKAILVLVSVLGVSAIRLYSRFPNGTDDGREALRSWLVKDYEGLGPRALAQRVADYRAGLPDRTPPLQAVAPHVEFVSVSAQGGREAMVVRTEVSVDGGPPPDDRLVRYLFLATKVGGGWMVLAEADSFQYYAALLR